MFTTSETFLPLQSETLDPKQFVRSVVPESLIGRPIGLQKDETENLIVKDWLEQEVLVMAIPA